MTSCTYNFIGCFETLPPHLLVPLHLPGLFEKLSFQRQTRIDRSASASLTQQFTFSEKRVMFLQNSTFIRRFREGLDVRNEHLLKISTLKILLEDRHLEGSVDDEDGVPERHLLSESSVTDKWVGASWPVSLHFTSFLLQRAEASGLARSPY